MMIDTASFNLVRRRPLAPVTQGSSPCAVALPCSLTVGHKILTLVCAGSIPVVEAMYMV